MSTKEIDAASPRELETQTWKEGGMKTRSQYFHRLLPGDENNLSLLPNLFSLFIHSNYNLWPLYNTPLSPSSLENGIEVLLLLLVSPPLVTLMLGSFMCLLLFPWFPASLSCLYLSSHFFFISCIQFLSLLRQMPSPGETEEVKFLYHLNNRHEEWGKFKWKYMLSLAVTRAKQQMNEWKEVTRMESHEMREMITHLEISFPRFLWTRLSVLTFAYRLWILHESFNNLERSWSRQHFTCLVLCIKDCFLYDSLSWQQFSSTVFISCGS